MKFWEKKCDCCEREWELKIPYGKGYLYLCNKHASVYLGFEQAILKKKDGRKIRKRTV